MINHSAKCIILSYIHIRKTRQEIVQREKLSPCCRCAVVGCYSTEDYYLEREGVFLLVDLLEVCPKNMHNLILGCLLDLCENPKTVNHVLTWRGKGNSTVAHLLCEIWRAEEMEIGARRDAHGAITGAV